MQSQIDLFTESLSGDDIPTFTNPLLKAVWHGLRGDWEDAHSIAQDDESREAAWIHAWLHRMEGDSSNAAYWYRRAQRPVAKDASLKDEGLAIAEFLSSAVS